MIWTVFLPLVFRKHCATTLWWNWEVVKFREKCMLHEQFESNKTYANACQIGAKQWITLSCSWNIQYAINSQPCLDLLDRPSQKGSKCSCLLNESWQQQQWLLTGLFLLEAQWPVWTWKSIKSHEILRSPVSQLCMCTQTDKEGKLTVVPSICFSQILLTAVIYIQDSPHTPHKYTHLIHTRFLGWCESVYSFGRGQLHTWWQLETVVLAQVRVCERGRAGRTGPQAYPSGSAQPAHSSSFSTGASTGMSPLCKESLCWRWAPRVIEKALQEDK